MAGNGFPILTTGLRDTTAARAPAESAKARRRGPLAHLGARLNRGRCVGQLRTPQQCKLAGGPGSASRAASFYETAGRVKFGFGFLVSIYRAVCLCFSRFHLGLLFALSSDPQGPGWWPRFREPYGELTWDHAQLRLVAA